MRRRHVGNDDGITLFPFLAVLICTMGSLIVLLVVVVQQARAHAEDRSRQRAEDAVQTRQLIAKQREKLEHEREDLAWKAEVLRQSRTQTMAQLEDARRVLSHLEAEIRDLKRQIDLLAAEAEDVAQQRQLDDEERQRREQLRAQLLSALAAAEEQLEAAKSQTDKPQSYSIVPYDGPHGTQRRPIYVECRGDRIILQPEGIELGSDDFEEPITDDNPLASALRAKREYLGRVLGDRDAQPYPLLIVRPDGARAYAAARAAMTAWDSEFGYELVGEEMALEYPNTDRTLVAVMSEAVDEARQRREYMKQIAPARFGRMAGGGMSGAGGAGPSGPGGGGLLTASRTGGFVSGRSGDAYEPAPRIGRGTSDSSYDGQWDEPYGAGGSGSDRQGEEATSSAGPSGQSPSGGQGTSSRDRSSRGSNGRSNAEATGDRVADGTDNPQAGPAGAQSTDGHLAHGSDGTERSGELARTEGRGSSQSGSSSGTSGPSGRAGSSSGPNALGAAGTQTSQSAGGSPSAGSGAAAGAGEELAATRGADWGLPERSQGATGITRPIRIKLYDRQLELQPEDRRQETPVVMEMPENLRDGIDELVTKVWQRMESWGIAGPGLYWKPVLVVDTRSEDRYVELATLLKDSGIVVQRK